jgi:hypothetical protein
MKLRDVLGVAAVAAVTMAFVLATLGPGRVGANDAPEGIKPMIAQPKLTVDGCEFTLSTDKPTYEPGESPVLEIAATNPTGEPVKTAVRVGMSSLGLESMISRVPRRPQSLWFRDCPVELAAGETKTVTLPTEIQLVALQTVSFTLSSAEQGILARLLSVPPGVQGGGPNVQANVNTVGPAVNVIEALPEK